jgi:CPA1 family monovalent cation:H+ antiporter
MHELQLDRLSRLERRRDRDDDGDKVAAKLDRVELGLIQTERDYINSLLRDGRIGDDTRRRIERDLDLREESIRRGSADGEDHG